MDTYFYFFLGFIFLLIGAKWLVDGAGSIGKKSGLPQLVIGLTIVALGTSLPEMVINIFASLEGFTDLAIANVVGSNITNTLLIIGIAAMIYPIAMTGSRNRFNTLLSLMATLVLFMLCYLSFYEEDKNFITRVDGIILLGLLVLFLYFSFKRKSGDALTEREEEIKVMGWNRSIAYALLGAAGIFLGGKWIVDSTDQIASDLGLSQSAIGLTLIAATTSLPELVTSIVAAMKKNTDMAVGNAVGSNLFNILLVLGLSAVITPIKYNPDEMNVQIVILILATLLVMAFIRYEIGAPKKAISRIEGSLLVILYVLFVLYSVGIIASPKWF
jgi:cation:H+ antiporter